MQKESFQGMDWLSCDLFPKNSLLASRIPAHIPIAIVLTWLGSMELVDTRTRLLART
jgi:hypothetical protein